LLKNYKTTKRQSIQQQKIENPQKQKVTEKQNTAYWPMIDCQPSVFKFPGINVFDVNSKNLFEFFLQSRFVPGGCGLELSSFVLV